MIIQGINFLSISLHAGWGILQCLGTSLGAVASYLIKYYKPKDILFASVRGDIQHFHCHLLPLRETEEAKWRRSMKGKGYEKGHLIEFIGYLEKCGDEAAKREREKMDWDTEQQRDVITKKLQPVVKALRLLTSYCKV